jgi:ankyrin repeat protein
LGGNVTIFCGKKLRVAFSSIIHSYTLSAFSPIKQKYNPVLSEPPDFSDDEKTDIDDESLDDEVTQILKLHSVSDEILSAYKSLRESMTPVQSHFMHIDSPKILQGCKGSGKTTALLGDMVKYVISKPASKLIYLHQSPTRLSEAKLKWHEITHAEDEHVEFNTVVNFLGEPLIVDRKDFLVFQQWLKLQGMRYGFNQELDSENIFKALLKFEEIGPEMFFLTVAFDEDDRQTLLKLGYDFKKHLQQIRYDLIVIDDAERLEISQLEEIQELSQAGNVCYAFDQHNTNMSHDKRLFLKKLQALPFNEVKLEGTFQYSDAVIEIVNHLLNLKCSLTDGKKEILTRASETPPLDGEKDILNAQQQDKLKIYQQLVAEQQFKIICHAQHIIEAKALFQTEEVYSYEQSEDMSSDGIILFNPLSEPDAVELNIKMKKQEELQRSEYLEKLISSIQKAKKQIVLYQDFVSAKQKHDIAKLFEYLSDGFVVQCEAEKVKSFSASLVLPDKVQVPVVIYSKPRFRISPAGQKIIELIENFNLEKFIDYINKHHRLDNVFFMPLNDEQKNLYHFLLENSNHLREYFKLMLYSNQILLTAPLKDMLNKTPKENPLRTLLVDMICMQKSILKNKKRNMDLTNPLDTLVECNLIDEIDIFFAKARELQIDIPYQDAAIIAVRKNDITAIEKLREYGCDLFFLDDKGNNLLHYAVSSTKNTPMIQLLLSLSFDINQQNKDGKTPLMIAIEKAPSFGRLIIDLIKREVQKKQLASVSMFSDNKENNPVPPKALPSGKT